MAVETTVTSASFTGTGVSSVYAPGFYANSSDQIKVHVDGVLKTIGDDYAVNNIGAAVGCNIVATFALGSAVLVERQTPITQLVDTQNNETILEDVLDAEFDKLTMIAQEINSKADKALAGVAAGAGAAFIATATASTVLAKNDFVNLYDNAGVFSVRKADANDPTKFANGFVLAAYGIGDAVAVALAGLNPILVAAALPEVWLSGTTPGSFTTVAPSAAGQIVQSLGPALPLAGIFFTPRGSILL